MDHIKKYFKSLERIPNNTVVSRMDQILNNLVLMAYAKSYAF
jgi:hypothetical protein